VQTFTVETIGIVHSPFKEKFGVPRQPGLVAAKCQVELIPPFNQVEAVKGLEGFSHIWISFIFHQAIREQWRPAVRPPRLGGNKTTGVFASRSPFRPNNLGLSVVKLEKIEQQGKKLLLHVTGLDVIDGTPVVDIKPYIPYVDAVENAVGGFAETVPQPCLAVDFAAEAELHLSSQSNANLRQLIVDVLSLDPRPAYKRSELQGNYGMLLDDFNIRWEILDDQIWVLSVIPA